MNARKWISNCFAGCFSVSLISLIAPELKAESGFIPQSHLKIKYSINAASFDYSRLSYEPVAVNSTRSNTFNLPSRKSNQLQNNAGKAVYKMLTVSHKKLATQLAGAALFYRLDSVEMAAPLKNSLIYVKQKTRLNFGKCSQVRLSTKRLKAHSCFFNNNAKLEFHANYKMDAFRLKFNWPL